MPSEILELINKIPEWLGQAFVGAIGWFGHMGYTAWKRKRLPFKEDKKRFEYVISSIIPNSFYYFQSADFCSLPKAIFDQLYDTEYKLTPINMPDYINKKLANREKVLTQALLAFNGYMAQNTFPHRNNSSVFTIYADNYDEYNQEHARTAQAKINQAISRRDNLIAAFEDYRNFGNKIFAQRVGE